MSTATEGIAWILISMVFIGAWLFLGLLIYTDIHSVGWEAWHKDKKPLIRFFFIWLIILIAVLIAFA